MKNAFFQRIFFQGLMFLLAISLASASKVELYFFYGQGCPHCAHMAPFLDSLQQKYPELEVKKFEVYFDQSNRELFQKLAESYGTTVQGVPTVFIGKHVLVGYSKQREVELENIVKECIANGCPSPASYIKQETKNNVSVSVAEYTKFSPNKFGIGVFAVLVAIVIGSILFLVFGVKRLAKKQK